MSNLSVKDTSSVESLMRHLTAVFSAIPENPTTEMSTETRSVSNEKISGPSQGLGAPRQNLWPFEKSETVLHWQHSARLSTAVLGHDLATITLSDL